MVDHRPADGNNLGNVDIDSTTSATSSDPTNRARVPPIRSKPAHYSLPE